VQNELDSMQDKIRKVRHTFIIYSWMILA
jgi:hypothetical protein